jgi:hypothetical protein
MFKCLLDQIFFATQQDFLFLALCAYNDVNQLPEVIKEVKRTFFSTWLADCSLWPLVNFVGFAYVPFQLQPTYMAAIQLFWQLYISTVASNESKQRRSEDQRRLRKVFDEIDLDKNGFVDEQELVEALRLRGRVVSVEQARQMVSEGDLETADGQISFGEFLAVVARGEALGTTAGLWAAVQAEIRLDKGAKAVMRKLSDLNKGAKADTPSPPSTSPVTPVVPVVPMSPPTNAISFENIISSDWNRPSKESLVNASAGFSLFTATALFRKIIMKI